MLNRIAGFAKDITVGKRTHGLIFQITNQCNSKCLMCFKWNELNKDADKELTLSEIEALTEQLGKLSSVILGGGEPFMRPDLPEICALFEKNCKVKIISIPTNALLPTIIPKTVDSILDKTANAKIIIGLSIDGVGELHNKIRGVKGAFDKLVETYRTLSKINKKRFELAANTTVSNLNIKEIENILNYVKNEMPAIKHHTFETIRGNYNKERIQPPTTEQYEEIAALEKRPLEKYYHLKAIETIKSKKQIVPCKAGKQTPVIDALGNVYACEILPAIGNVRSASYNDIWGNNTKWNRLKEIIEGNKCYCTHICFMTSSIKLSRKELIKYSFFWLKQKRGS